MNERQEVEHGRHAEAVLENVAFKAAFEQIEKDIINQWKQSKDQQDREKLHLSLQLLSRLESVLKASIANGQVASQILERQSVIARLGQKLKQG
jgi:hypothetical protein